MQISLVYFVGEKDERVLFAKFYERFLDLFVEEGAGGVSRVDDDKTLGDNAGSGGFGDGFLDGSYRGRPVVGLVEVVRYRLALMLSKTRGIERVLRNWNKESGLGIIDEHVD